MTGQCNLLLIDDNSADIRLMIEAIRLSGIKKDVSVQYTYNGEDGWKKLEEAKEHCNPFHIVLLDLNMPRISGKELLEKIKNHPLYKDTLVFIMSNSDYEKDIEDCYQMGADGFFQKPSDFNRLIDFFISIRESLKMDIGMSGRQIELRYEEMRKVA